MNNEQPPQSPSREKAPTFTITLTEDPKLRKSLEAKLIEYKARLERDADVPPEQFGLDQFVNHYKSRILGTLLEKGSVNRDEAWDDLQLYFESRADDADREDFFDNAFKVIEAYNRNAISEVARGTGLPKVE